MIRNQKVRIIVWIQKKKLRDKRAKDRVVILGLNIEQRKREILRELNTKRRR